MIVTRVSKTATFTGDDPTAGDLRDFLTGVPIMAKIKIIGGATERGMIPQVVLTASWHTDPEIDH